MKTMKLLFAVLIVLITFSSSLQPQPRLIFNAYGGFLIPTGDLGLEPANIPDSVYYLETNYGMTFGINLFTGEMKYAFDKKGHVRGVLGFSINGFMNPGELLTLGLGNVVRETMGIISLNMGGEYSFIPEEKISPFVGASFTTNFISGSNFDSETRFGMQFNIGAQLTISNHFGLVGGFKYDIANLIGKETNVNKFSSSWRELPLSDEEYTYHGNTLDAKTISFIQFYFGFSFLSGQPKKPREKVF